MLFNKLIVFCVILSYQQYVCRDILNGNGSCDSGECNVFSHLNVWSEQERRLRSPKFNCCATTVNITLNYRLVDNFLQWNTTKRNRIVNKNELRISALPMAIAFEQTSTSAYNHHKIAFKCNINSRPYTRLTCIDSHSSSKLVSTDGRKLAIKHGFNGLFAYIIILTMAFISAIIILMDVFKYGFNIGFVRKSRQRSKQKYRANYSKEHQLTIIRRRTFTNISKLQTIPEEDEVQS